VYAFHLGPYDFSVSKDPHGFLAGDANERAIRALSQTDELKSGAALLNDRVVCDRTIGFDFKLISPSPQLDYRDQLHPLGSPGRPVSMSIGVGYTSYNQIHWA
jgi:hypothetical protein